MDLTVQNAYYFINDYYERIMNASSSTSSNRYSFSRIVEKYYDCPQMKEYWELNPSAAYYSQKIKKLKNFTVKVNVDELDWFDWYSSKNPCAYIVYLKDKKMIKVGKAKSFKTRIKGLQKDYGTIVPLHLFHFETEEQAYHMEIIMHSYFKEKYPYSFVPQDRFEHAFCTQEDVNALEGSAEMLRKIKWF